MRVSVHHEWGTLKDVMIGRMITEHLYIPEMTEEMKKEIDYIPKAKLDKIGENKGKLFIDVFLKILKDGHAILKTL